MADCHICRGTGIAHTAPHIAEVTQTMTACTCEAGRAMVARVNAEIRARQMNAELPESQREMLKLKGMI